MHAIIGLHLNLKVLPPDQDIVREGERPSECCLLLEGFACRYKFTPEGKRQIFSFHIAGDIPDLQSLHIDVMDHHLGTLTSCRVAFIPHESLSALMRSCPRVADVFWRDTLIDAAVFRERIRFVGAAKGMGGHALHGPRDTSARTDVIIFLAGVVLILVMGTVVWPLLAQSFRAMN